MDCQGRMDEASRPRNQRDTFELEWDGFVQSWCLCDVVYSRLAYKDFFVVVATKKDVQRSGSLYMPHLYSQGPIPSVASVPGSLAPSHAFAPAPRNSYQVRLSSQIVIGASNNSARLDRPFDLIDLSSLRNGPHKVYRTSLLHQQVITSLCQMTVISRCIFADEVEIEPRHHQGGDVVIVRTRM